MRKIGTDFPGYLTAAKIVADGGAVARLYDNTWFQQQMRRYQTGEPSEGKFAPFPPPTALLLVPLAGLAPLDALRVLTGISVLCLVGSIVLLTRILAWRWVETAAFVLLSGYAVLNGLRFGQPYILVATSCILGYYAYVKKWPLTAGICFGLFAPIKYFPLIFLIYFACRKQWRVLFGGLIAILALTSLSIAVLGLRIHEEFLASVLGNHLIGRLSMQDPFSASFQSFDSLFRRLFIFDPALNPQPLAALPLLDLIAVPLVKAALFGAAGATLVRLVSWETAAAADAASLGILGILTLLIAPATATYHFVLLWLPVGLLAGYFFRRGARGHAYFLVGTYVLIGFFPYAITAPFEGRGALTALAYPRLWLLLAMFAGSLHFFWRPRKAGRELEPQPAPRPVCSA